MTKHPAGRPARPRASFFLPLLFLFACLLASFLLGAAREEIVVPSTLTFTDAASTEPSSTIFNRPTDPIARCFLASSSR